MKRFIYTIALLLSIYSTSLAQGVTPGQGVVRVAALPATCTATGSDGSSAPVRYQGKIYICTATNTWTESGTGATVVDATIDVDGKASLGDKAVVTVASLSSTYLCNSGRAGQTVNVSDGNKGQRTCRLTTGSTYTWVDDDPVVRPERYGWATGASAANNATYLQAAVDAAIAAGIGEIIFPSGTFEWSTSITISASNLTFRGQGQATVLRFSGSGPAFRNSDWTSVKNSIHFKDFWLYAYGSAINSATSIGIDLSSQTDCVVDNVYLYNFGTGILLDGHRPATGTAYSTYYNKITNSFVGTTSDSYTNCVKGISIVNGANSNTIENLKGSRYLDPISIGDGSYEAPNQIDIKNPILESYLRYGINITKGFGVDIKGGRYESSFTAIKIANTLADVIGVRIDNPYFQISGSATVLDTTNPTVAISGSSLNSNTHQIAGIGASGTNLIGNGGQEGWGNTGTTTLLGWFNVNGTTWTATTASSSRITTPIKSGTYATQFTSAVGAGQASPIFSVVAGKPYTLSYYSASNSLTNGHRFAIRWFDSAGAQITSGWTDDSYYGIGDNFEAGVSGLSYNVTYNAWLIGADITHAIINTYYRRGAIVNAPTGAVTAQIAIITITTGGGVLYVDDVQFVAGAATWQAIDRPFPTGGGTLLGNLTAPKVVVADASVGAGSLSIGVNGSASQIKELNSNRIYYDAYNHVFQRENSSTGMMRLDQLGVLSFGSTVFSEDVGIKRNAAGKLEINSGTGGTFRDLQLRDLYTVNLAISSTSPTVTSAGTSPSITAHNGTAAFVVDVGTGGTATTIVLAMPTATTGWICHATNVTATAANRADQAVRQTASTTTSVTLQNQTVSTGAALAFTASDAVRCQCTAY